MSSLPRGTIILLHAIQISIDMQGKGKVIYSMDALFGLPRKKSAGQSYRDPVNGHLLFYNQATVDEYVSTYQTSKQVHQEVKLFP